MHFYAMSGLGPIIRTLKGENLDDILNCCVQFTTSSPMFFLPPSLMQMGPKYLNGNMGSTMTNNCEASAASGSNAFAASGGSSRHTPAEHVQVGPG
jgi:hypothetical protein